MLTPEMINAYIAILNEELLLATGCTEPIAIAYAAARLRTVLGSLPERILVEVSGNIIKNVKSVVVPNTGGLKGIHAAVAAGVVAGDDTRQLQVISLEDAIKKMGMLPAQHFRIDKRGVLAEGNFADINIFDLDNLKINATFADVHHYSTGMDYVIVNGVPVIVHDVHTGKRAGRVLRRLPRK